MNDGGLTGGILFHSVVIKWYKYDEIDTTLNLLVCYPDGDLREVFYENVFYTQLDESVRGMTILNAERITLDEFTKLKEMMGRGFKLFMHYMEYNAEYIVLADRMAVSD